MKQAILAIVLLIVASCSDKEAVMNKISQKDSVALATCWNAINNIYADPDSALKIFGQAATIYKHNNDTNGLFLYYTKAMEIHITMRSDTITGKKYVDSSWQLMHGTGRKGLKYLALFNSSVYHYLTNNDTQSIHYLLESLKVQPHPIDSLFYINAHTILAVLNKTQGNIEIASDFYEPVMRYNERRPNSVEKIGLFINGYYFANKYSATGRARGKKYLFAAKAVAEGIGDTTMTTDLFTNLTGYYNEVGQMDSCIYFARKSVDIALRSPKDFQNNEIPFIILGRQYIDSGNYAQAKEMLQKFDRMALPFHSLYNEAEYHELKYKISKHKRNLASALAALEKNVALNEKFSRDEKNEQLLQHEREMKKAAATVIMVRNNQMEQQRLYTVSLVIFSILLTALVLILYLYWRNKRKLETEKWLDIQKHKEYESQKKLFEERSRIAGEMHDDLGSTLTSTMMAIEMVKLKPRETAPLEMIDRCVNQLNDQINEIIWNMNIKNDKLESLSDYILRFASCFLKEASIRLSWNERLTEKNIPISGQQRRTIYLCVKELINNIVKHAKATEVTLDIVYVQNQLIIEIKDNGLGLGNSNAKTLCSGNGMVNIRKRIESMNGIVVWQDETPGTVVHILVPLPQIMIAPLSVNNGLPGVETN